MWAECYGGDQYHNEYGMQGPRLDETVQTAITEDFERYMKELLADVISLTTKMKTATEANYPVLIKYLR